MKTILRNGHALVATIETSEITHTRVFGCGFWTALWAVMFPRWYEERTIPKLYIKANRWADLVVSNHEKYKNHV